MPNDPTSTDKGALTVVNDAGISVGSAGELSYAELAGAALTTDIHSVLGERRVIEDKEELCGKPFVLLNWREALSEDFTVVDSNGVIRPRAYVIVEAMLETSEVVVFTDGGSGIPEQLRKLLDCTGRKGPFRCPEGLRRSDYKVKLNGAPTSASTYWLA